MSVLNDSFSYLNSLKESFRELDAPKAALIAESQRRPEMRVGVTRTVVMVASLWSASGVRRMCSA
ncbi:hypothetical protein GCM10022247_46020 [Allokutzneria multivorans]|uniref:Uncharacterized protein n=1 Tax=Allokutzneria multivorans TaxID=1142134 RepID=A0ABP7SWE3_9PSEU